MKAWESTDAADRLLTESVSGVPRRTNTWTLNGVLASAITPAGTTVYTSDLMDELTSLTLPDGSTVGYTTDTSGNRTSRTVDGALDVSWVCDELPPLPVRIGESNATGVMTSSWMLSDSFLNVAASVSTSGVVSGTRGSPVTLPAWDASNIAVV